MLAYGVFRISWEVQCSVVPMFDADDGEVQRVLMTDLRARHGRLRVLMSADELDQALLPPERAPGAQARWLPAARCPTPRKSFVSPGLHGVETTEVPRSLR